MPKAFNWQRFVTGGRTGILVFLEAVTAEPAEAATDFEFVTPSPDTDITVSTVLAWV